jgi:hypothetical protein
MIAKDVINMILLDGVIDYKPNGLGALTKIP